MPAASRRAVDVPPIRGRRLLLRPYRPDELEVVVAAVRGFGADVQPWGPPSRDKLRRRVLRSGKLWRGRVVLGMEARGRLIGEIQSYHHAEMPPGRIGLGISIFDAAERGRGYGTDAVRLFTRWVLSTGVGELMEAGTAPSNTAMRRVLVKTGWREIGVERYHGAEFVMFELTRSR